MSTAVASADSAPAPAVSAPTTSATPFFCSKCGAWGYTAEARQRWREGHGYGAVANRTVAPAPAAVVLPKAPVPARNDLLDLLVERSLSIDTIRGRVGGGRELF